MLTAIQLMAVRRSAEVEINAAKVVDESPLELGDFRARWKPKRALGNRRFARALLEEIGRVLHGKRPRLGSHQHAHPRRLRNRCRREEQAGDCGSDGHSRRIPVDPTGHAFPCHRRRLWHGIRPFRGHCPTITTDGDYPAATNCAPKLFATKSTKARTRVDSCSRCG